MESSEAEPSESRPEEDGAAPGSEPQPPDTVRVRGWRPQPGCPPPRGLRPRRGLARGAEHRPFLSALPGRLRRRPGEGARGSGGAGRPGPGGR